MDDPKKDIPKALVFGGLLMAVFYILPAAGFNVALSPDVVAKMDPENVVEVLNTLFNAVGIAPAVVNVLVIIAGFMFIYTFIANIASWSFGVNSVAKYSADDGGLPKIFSKTNKDGVPHMASILNGIVASVIVIVGIILGEVSETASNLFWMFFSLSLVTLLISYIPMFLAFLKLRKVDKTERVYKVPGSEGFIKVFAIVPFVLLILGVIFTLFGDFSMEYIIENLPLIIGVVASVIVIAGIVLGEVSETASNLFWTFFSLSLVTLLISYIPMFLAFLKLRQTDKTKRVYKVPGSEGFIKVFAIVPFVLLILGVVFTLFGDFSAEYINENMPLIVGVVVSLVVQEILAARVKEVPSKKEK
jgi:amino acid transporter